MVKIINAKSPNLELLLDCALGPSIIIEVY